MPAGVTFSIDAREFNETLRRYKQFSKRDIATICNTKGLFITRNAIIETPKADKSGIEKELGEFVTVQRQTKKGKTITRKVLKLTQSSRKPAPLAALIVQSRRKKEGKRGLYGKEMEKAIKSLRSGRIRSTAFLKSGWLTPIKKLLPFADRRGSPKQESGVKQYRNAKGDATPARESNWKASATFVNKAGANRNNKAALLTYGLPALQRAVDRETASMNQYMEKKLKESAQAAGIHTG